MAPWPTSSIFPRFSSFPPEPRSQIWRDYLPDLDCVALCKYKTGYWRPKRHSKAKIEEQQSPSGDESKSNFCYDVPDVQVDMAIIFVNRETRGHGIEMHWSEDKQCHIFVCPFDPLRDAIFIKADQWEEYFADPL